MSNLIKQFVEVGFYRYGDVDPYPPTRENPVRKHGNRYYGHLVCPECEALNIRLIERNGDFAEACCLDCGCEFRKFREEIKE